MSDIIGALPASYTPPKGSTSKHTAPSHARTLLPVGPAYLAHLRLTLKNLTFEEHDALVAEELRLSQPEGTGSEDDFGVGDEPEGEELLALDPKEWKRQDHYAVLGLSHLRYKATADQIKVAHRKKVLKHHPDKKATTAASAPAAAATQNSLFHAGEDTKTNTNDDAFFKCISKAHEILTNPSRRAAFDSVDPYYLTSTVTGPYSVVFSVEDFELVDSVTPDQDPLPTPQEYTKLHKSNPEKAEKLFFDRFGKTFELEARFSKKDGVPSLGGIDASKESVEAFYGFWYGFESWRGFEWLDKEVNEGSDSRDDKRYTEKKNKSERARRKKEDTARLRNLVDTALAIDPRIKRIKAEEKAAREAKKVKPAAVSKKEEEEKRKEAERLANEQKKVDEENARADAKKAKAAAATAAKKARRAEREKAEADAAK